MSKNVFLLFVIAFACSSVHAEKFTCFHHGKGDMVAYSGLNYLKKIKDQKKRNKKISELIVHGAYVGYPGLSEELRRLYEKEFYKQVDESHLKKIAQGIKDKKNRYFNDYVETFKVVLESYMFCNKKMINQVYDYFLTVQETIKDQCDKARWGDCNVYEDDEDYDQDLVGSFWKDNREFPRERAIRKCIEHFDETYVRWLRKYLSDKCSDLKMGCLNKIVDYFKQNLVLHRELSECEEQRKYVEQDRYELDYEFEAVEKERKVLDKKLSKLYKENDNFYDQLYRKKGLTNSKKSQREIDENLKKKDLFLGEFKKYYNKKSKHLDIDQRKLDDFKRGFIDLELYYTKEEEKVEQEINDLDEKNTEIEMFEFQLDDEYNGLLEQSNDVSIDRMNELIELFSKLSLDD